jgi:hypothetical protein
VGEIEHGVAHQNMVIEIKDIKSNHEIGPAQTLDQIVDARFVKNFVAGSARAIGHTDRHLHVALAIPTAGVIGRALGFKIEVDNVAHQEVEN